MSIILPMSTTGTDAWVTPGEAAPIVRRSRKTVTRWADEGRFGDTIRTTTGFRLIRLDAVRQVARELGLVVAP
jgi:hypothetical protein